MTAVLRPPTPPSAKAPRPAPVPALVGTADDPEWYRSGGIYEMHVRAFADSNGDGIGDFPGLTAHLDYVAELGVTAIWLLPFYPSPGRDDGYDIADYMSVNPDYGTLAQFKKFLKAAHDRGIRVITELVVNHTSDQHPWFQRARRAPAGSRWRNFYTWSDDDSRWPDARIIFSDTEASNWAWDPVAGQYYWHRFFSHQPDLNYDNPEVQAAITKVVDFWLGMGVDGLRLDAVPYLYQRDGTNCENLPETHAFLRGLRRHVDANFPGRMLLAEANQWPEDAAEYFGDGDECHMNFHFPLMPRMFMALQMEHRTPIVDILEQTPALPEGGQWATFLRNHDELTLEMVTDEERDYMYRAYANDPQMRINVGIRRRLAPLLGNDRRRIELLNAVLYSLPGTQWATFLRNHDELTLEMVTEEERDQMYRAYAADPTARLNLGIRRRLAPLLRSRRKLELANALLFSLPGSPVLYYGDEIGMGDNVYLGDRDGVRTPMQWTGDRNAGFSHADFAQLYAPLLMDPVYGYQAVNVESELRNPSSFLRWLRRFIELRKEHPVFGLGTYAPIPPSNPRVFAHIRTHEDDIALCVHNLARTAQAVELDLSAYEGHRPVEMLGNSRFPRIGELPYLLTLAPRGFFWFLLVPESGEPDGEPAPDHDDKGG